MEFKIKQEVESEESRKERQSNFIERSRALDFGAWDHPPRIAIQISPKSSDKKDFDSAIAEPNLRSKLRTFHSDAYGDSDSIKHDIDPFIIENSISRASLTSDGIFEAVRSSYVLAEVEQESIDNLPYELEPNKSSEAKVLPLDHPGRNFEEDIINVIKSTLDFFDGLKVPEVDVCIILIDAEGYALVKHSERSSARIKAKELVEEFSIELRHEHIDKFVANYLKRFFNRIRSEARFPKLK